MFERHLYLCPKEVCTFHRKVSVPLGPKYREFFQPPKGFPEKFRGLPEKSRGLHHLNVANAAGQEGVKRLSMQSVVKRIDDLHSEIRHIAHVTRDKHHTMPKGRGSDLSINKWLGLSYAKRISHQLAPRH